MHDNAQTQVASRLIKGDLSRPIPEFTIAIPTYRRSKTLVRALNSVDNLVNAPPFDLLVVDNDDTGDELECVISRNQENLYYYKNEQNIGLYGNWTRCCALARTPWVCLLHDDDELMPQYLKRIADTLKKVKLDGLRVGEILVLPHESKDNLDKPVGILQKLSHYTNKQYLDQPGKLEILTYKYFKYLRALSPAGTIMRKDVVEQLGGWNADYDFAAEFDFNTRLISDYKVGCFGNH